MIKKDNQYVALTKCFFCGGDHQIILHRRFRDISEIHGKVFDMTPCNECEARMKQGVILLEIDEEKSPKDWWKQEMPNPYRTGAMFVMKDEAVMRIFNAETAERIVNKTRWAFISSSVVQKLGIEVPA